MSVTATFAWNAISDDQFEELVYAVIASLGPDQIKWRTGPGDKGRDVEATFTRRDGIGELVNETYYVEAKHHQSGVSPTDIAGALAWAAAEVPDVLVLAVSSHLTTPCREHVQAWERNNRRVRVVLWERKDLENRVLAHEAPRGVGVQLGLIPAAVYDLLPTQPDGVRTGPTDVGLEMEYRYWITDEEVDKLSYVISTLQSLGEALDAESGAQGKHFELVCLAVPNWCTFLTLLQAQLKLQIAIRDYLVAQVSGAGNAALVDLAERLKRRVEEVRERGDSSFHID